MSNGTTVYQELLRALAEHTRPILLGNAASQRLREYAEKRLEPLRGAPPEDCTRVLFELPAWLLHHGYVEAENRTRLPALKSITCAVVAVICPELRIAAYSAYIEAALDDTTDVESVGQLTYCELVSLFQCQYLHILVPRRFEDPADQAIADLLEDWAETAREVDGALVPIPESFRAETSTPTGGGRAFEDHAHEASEPVADSTEPDPLDPTAWVPTLHELVEELAESFQLDHARLLAHRPPRPSAAEFAPTGVLVRMFTDALPDSVLGPNGPISHDQLQLGFEHVADHEPWELWNVVDRPDATEAALLDALRGLPA